MTTKPDAREGEIVRGAGDDLVHPTEPPVVARLVVEIRSDGTTTIARGALEDAVSNQRVAIEATGTTPLSLAIQLARSMMAAPKMLRRSLRRGRIARGALSGPRRRWWSRR